MILKDLAAITELDLKSLIENSVLEQKTLDYKKMLPGNSDSEKKEFLADVSSFANQRILFLKNDEVDYEISLEDILKAEIKRVMRIGDPYLRLNLKNGKTIHMVFESIGERER